MAQRVFANEKWYIERSEPEERFAGTLEPVTPPSGLASRSALSYVLRTGVGELPIYATGIEGLLGSLVGRPAIIRGKPIDFSSVGFTVEVWIGEIDIVLKA